jgi:hypothetical protein
MGDGYIRERISEREGRDWIEQQAESLAEGELAAERTRTFEGPGGERLNAVPVKSRAPKTSYLCEHCHTHRRTSEIVRVRPGVVNRTGAHRVKTFHGRQLPGYWVQVCWPCRDHLKPLIGFREAERRLA